jgi:RNA polymerase sigma-70 factor, ECF subfamily
MDKKDKINEQSLVERAKISTDAFSQLYDLYFSKIFRYISWRVGNRNDAEDLVSDIFIKALDKINTFKWRSGATFSSWIFRIAHNALIDYYRSSSNKTFVNIDDMPEIEANEILPDEKYDRKLLFNKFYNIIQELPERQAEIITMRFFSGMQNKEIAKVLNIKERSVASSLCRGLQEMHNKFIKPHSIVS